MADETNAGPTRRTLIRAGLIGGALLAVGGIGLELQTTAPETPPGTLRAFSPRAFSILVAVADTVCPGDGRALPPASEIDVPLDIDAYAAKLAPVDVTQLEQALRLLESPLAGLFLGGRVQPFTRLEPERREAVLRSWRDSRFGVLRSAYVALRNLVVTTYHVHPRVHAAIGYPGPPDFRQADAPAIQPRQPQETEG